MSDESIESLLAEVLLDQQDDHSAEENLLIFLVMEPFIKQFRKQGMSNKEILDLCREIDEKRNE